MSIDTISLEKVKKVADLCKLDVSGSEERLAEMFNETLKYIEILEELDLKNVPETYQVTGLINVFQTGEENKATISKQEALSNAKEVVDGLFATKAVFDR